MRDYSDWVYFMNRAPGRRGPRGGEGRGGGGSLSVSRVGVKVYHPLKLELPHHEKVVPGIKMQYNSSLLKSPARRVLDRGALGLL